MEEKSIDCEECVLCNVCEGCGGVEVNLSLGEGLVYERLFSLREGQFADLLRKGSGGH
ncbi:hypothetical protein COLO4_33219 [Corchorus olitorius]|uniref:Uncharacterized protein n=1 Tax=Corchorus olitorius TaxID=93759 RepID=A0A1R3GVK6_9ROSI|nr:hypothetical protein COLO4_33219 [Corchorus olitorius]